MENLSKNRTTFNQRQIIQTIQNKWLPYKINFVIIGFLEQKCSVLFSVVYMDDTKHFCSRTNPNRNAFWFFNGENGSYLHFPNFFMQTSQLLSSTLWLAYIYTPTPKKSTPAIEIKRNHSQLLLNVRYLPLSIKVNWIIYDRNWFFNFSRPKLLKKTISQRELLSVRFTWNLKLYTMPFHVSFRSTQTEQRHVTYCACIKNLAIFQLLSKVLMCQSFGTKIDRWSASSGYLLALKYNIFVSKMAHGYASV